MWRSDRYSSRRVRRCHYQRCRSDTSLALSARAIRRNCNAISTQQEQAMKALLAAAALTLIATTEVSAQSAS